MGDPGNGTHVLLPFPRGAREPGRLGSVFSPHYQSRMPISTDVTVILELRQFLCEQKREEALYARVS